MLARYHIIRGKRPPSAPLPDGVRQDTRKHTQHILRPEAEAVDRYLANPDLEHFAAFRSSYLRTLKARLHADRPTFEALASLARDANVYLGCNCPTAKNPDVQHCHTTLALHFMAEHFPDLRVVFPD